MTHRPKPPDWVLHSSPGHNRPLVPRVERLARPVRVVAAELESRATLPFEELYRPTRSGLGFTLLDHDLARRSAWALLGEWLVAASVGATCARDGLVASHEWFWQGSDRSLGAVPDVAAPIWVESAIELRSVLPYLLDPMAAATRRDVLKAHSSAHERRTRKAAGVYYTPGDVAHLMVDRIVSVKEVENSDLWLDPAHGSGVFLRAVFSALLGRPDAADRIYGVDLDPIAAEIASFVLTAEDLACNPDGVSPWQRWHRFRKNFVTGDALLIEHSASPQQQSLLFEDGSGPLDGHPLGRFEPWRIHEVFPETAASGFARIVANPPYAPLQQSASTNHIPSLHPVTGRSARADISPMFVELCVDLLPDAGALALVLPLSIVSSTRSPFPEIRTHLSAQPGALDLLSFDRVPDALFGDDIKTRNAIVHLDKTATDQLSASPLYRWTSRTRKTALSQIPLVSIADLEGVPETIPKIGTEWERNLFQACADGQHHLDHWHSSRRLLPLHRISQDFGEDHAGLVAVAPTAYNFLGVIREPVRAVTDGHDSQSGFTVLPLGSMDQASAAYALLSSRLAFWLWHVTGDGFHVTGSLYRRLPVPWADSSRTERLARLGDRLWESVLRNPSISTNRGRSTVTYPTWRQVELIDAIDRELENLIGIAFAADLAAWHEDLVIVDPDSERRRSLRKKK